MRFFLSLLGGFLSLSTVGDLWKKFETFRSRVGVPTSSCFSGSPSNRSWLVTMEVACEDGTKLVAPTAAGANPGDEGDGFLLAAATGAEGDRPLGAVGLEDDVEPNAFGGDGDPECFCRRPCGKPGDFLEGTVLLR